MYVQLILVHLYNLWFSFRLVVRMKVQGRKLVTEGIMYHGSGT